MRRRSVIVLAIIALAAAAFLATRTRSTALEVDVATIEAVPTLQSFVTASGEIVAAKYADIGSAVMGRLVELPVKEGDVVRAGQVVARIDPVQASSGADAADASLSALEADARAAMTQVRAAEAALSEAQTRSAQLTTSLKRARELRDSGLLPASDFDDAVAADAAASAQVAGATASLERARQAAGAAERRIAQGRAERVRARDALSKTDITAPIDGVVTRLDVEAGEMVVIGVQNQPGTILMTISDLSAVNAEVKVAEADVMRLKEGMSSAVTLESLPGQRYDGRIVEIGASALPLAGGQAAAREFRVRIRLDRADGRLRPGLTCDAEILAAERRNVTAVPLQAVVDRNGATGVFTVTDGAVQFTKVTTGIIGGLMIEVSGVSAGAQVVSGPIQALRDLKDGDRVTARRGAR
ncbi:MAG TPA: efflux RND transporter periplasmic adaptor subunit [Vicinamibacterales bacterium]|nr:efflux RND transporter periplasmic adaptor subunit [Vicinamibacterales bacterium]